MTTALAIAGLFLIGGLFAWALCAAAGQVPKDDEALRCEATTHQAIAFSIKARPDASVVVTGPRDLIEEFFNAACANERTADICAIGGGAYRCVIYKDGKHRDELAEAKRLINNLDNNLDKNI